MEVADGTLMIDHSLVVLGSISSTGCGEPSVTPGTLRTAIRRDVEANQDHVVHKDQGTHRERQNVLGKLFSAVRQRARFSPAISFKERLNDSIEALTPSTSKCILSDH